MESRPRQTPLIFDTPTTGDTYVGNAGDDVFNEHTDGTVAYGMGGNNIFNLQVNCTLTAVADTGQNTLDFASNPYAITFNMQETEGQTQYVMPGSTAHAVIVNDLGNAGTFSTLDCSNYGDTVTASTGSTIVGGGGMDTVMLSSVSSVTVDASAGRQHAREYGRLDPGQLHLPGRLGRRNRFRWGRQLLQRRQRHDRRHARLRRRLGRDDFQQLGHDGCRRFDQL